MPQQLPTVTAFYNTPIGVLRLEATEEALRAASFQEENNTIVFERTTHPVVSNVVQQLEEYFKGERRVFQLPLAPQGTAFQQKVWNELQKLKYGTTATYLQMAQRLGNKNSIRAAATANGRNPIAIIIPCHRVVGANGALTGYAGGLHRKQWLLEQEARHAGQPSLFGT